jgi:Zn ribbon nucleic-acid-binding protein
MLSWSDYLLCPHCGEWPEIDYEFEDKISIEKCTECGKEFVLHTRVSISFATEEVPK